MQDNQAVIATFTDHGAAESAVKELQKAGFDMKKLSIVGKDYHTEEHVVGYYNLGDRVATWGKFGAFWGGLFGILFGSAFVLIPGIGPVVIGGPLVSWLLGALESALVVGGLSALGAALFSIGIPKDSIIQYETEVKAGKFLLVAHGTEAEMARAAEILKNSGAQAVDTHPTTLQPATAQR
jgi:uncharacterized membrane protein